MTRILTQTMTLDHLCVSARNSERTVLLCGEKEAVMHAQELVLQRVQQDPWTRAGTYGTSTPDLILARIVVPAASAGAIIGRQGSNINALKEQTGAHIKVCLHITLILIQKLLLVEKVVDHRTYPYLMRCDQFYQFICSWCGRRKVLYRMSAWLISKVLSAHAFRS